MCIVCFIRSDVFFGFYICEVNVWLLWSSKGILIFLWQKFFIMHCIYCRHSSKKSFGRHQIKDWMTFQLAYGKTRQIIHLHCKFHHVCTWTKSGGEFLLQWCSHFSRVWIALSRNGFKRNIVTIFPTIEPTIRRLKSFDVNLFGKPLSFIFKIYIVTPFLLLTVRNNLKMISCRSV